MSDTPNLALPLIAAAQAQKHVPHNEALLAIDALLHCAVLDKDRSAPPPGPAEAARYIVAPGASGAWAGHAGAIAAWQDGTWAFHGPNAGFLVFVLDESLLYFFTGSAWVPLTSALTAIQDLGLLGIGTTADASNPLSAKLNAALWTAKTAAEGGTGDLRYTLNKEAAGNVLSLLFQTGYSGRLEFGLLGSDSPALKVSPTGSGWVTALSVDGGTGGVDLLSAATDLASAATVDLGAVATRKARITGTAAITSFGTGAHKERLLTFAGTPTLTHNATSLILPGAATIATAAGDTAYATSDGSGNWTIRHYQRASGRSLVAPAAAEVMGLGGDAATNAIDPRSISADLASAATTDLGAANARKLRITGTATITSFGTAANRERLLTFAGALTLTHTATALILPGAANIVTAAGDTAYATSDPSGNWTVRHYSRMATGGPTVAQGLASTTANGLISAASQLKLNTLAYGANMVPNPDFESNLDGWSFNASGAAGAAGTVTSAAADGRSGTRYAVIDLGATGPQSGTPYLRSGLFPVEPAAWLEFLASVRADAAAPASSFYVQLNFFKSDGSASASSAVLGVMLLGSGQVGAGFCIMKAPALTTAWQVIGGSLQTPADAAQAYIQAYVIGTGTTARYHQIDDVVLRRAAGATALEPKAVANASMADVAAGTLKGRVSAGTGSPEDLSAAQARTALGLATTDSPAFAGLALSGPARVGVYTVATLPTPGTAGRTAFASNGRAFNGAGAQEAGGAGTGTLVGDNGSAWKVAGTNQTVAA